MEREAGIKSKRKLAVPVAVLDKFASKKMKKKVEETDTDSSSGEFRVLINHLISPFGASGVFIQF